MPPDILYKYRADTEFSVKIITDREVWLPVAKDLNDPFECQTGVIDQTWKNKVIRESEEAQLSGALFGPRFEMVETLFSLDRRQTKRWIKSLANASHSEKMAKLRKLYRDHGHEISDPSCIFVELGKQLASVGILSLSAVGDDQLMWAHYAAAHTGLAFGFAVEEGNRLASPKNLLEVTYADEKPTFTGGYMQEVQVFGGSNGLRSETRLSFQDPVFRASISTKPSTWAYEREWRYVHERSGAHPLPAPLKTVTFGLRMPEERKSFYASLLREHGHQIELLEARQVAPGKLGLAPAAIAS